MSKPSSRRNFRKQNPISLGLTGALGDDGVDSDGDFGGNAEDASNRAQRFATSLEGNQFRELEQQRVQERKQAISRGLIADPDKPTSLENAIEFVGTCTEMCPRFEREEREFKKNVHPLEQKEGQPGRIDPEKAVTMYHRSAAGIDQPLPSDVRTPATLKRTLDYLFHTIIHTQPPESTEPPTPLTALRYTHGFIRDRTRGIRQDFTYQRHVGITENIECHERIARFHILAIHELAKLEDAQFLKQETEQLNKTLISLIELYDDQRLDGKACRNEPEFRAYQLLSHLNDNEVARTILDLPDEIFTHPHLQLAFTFRSLAQRNFDTQKVGSKYNAEISLNFFSRFFKRVKQREVPFLIACLAHNKFGDVRRAGIRALMRAYPAPPKSVILKNGEDPSSMRAMPMALFVKLLACRDEREAMTIADSLAVEPYFPRGIDGLDPNVPLGFLINTSADFDDNGDAPPAEDFPEIEAKRHGVPYQDIIDGRLSQATATSPPRAKVEPRGRVHSGLAAVPTPPVFAFSPKPTLAPAPKPAFPGVPSLNPSADAFVPSGVKASSQAPAVPSFGSPLSGSGLSIQQPSSATAAGPANASSAFNPPPMAFSAGVAAGNNVAPASAFSFAKPSSVTPQPHIVPSSSPAPIPTSAPSSRLSLEIPAAPVKQVLPTSNTSKAPHSAKKISSGNIDRLAKRLASNAMISYTGQFVHKLTQRIINAEQVRRTDMRNHLQAERQKQLEKELSRGLLRRLVEEVVRAEVADAYGEEMWERPLRQKAFTWWRSRTRAKQSQRERAMQRSVTRSNFGQRVQALTLSSLGSPMDEGETRNVSSAPWPMGDVDQDIASSLRKASPVELSSRMQN
ncbi:actin cytoskeleton and mitosis protein [Naganishia albida]|nr:actin cytoskeleton and mitosis protein [Naganishia albida]